MQNTANNRKDKKNIMTTSESKALPERLSSLEQYPSGQYLYYNWKHDEYKTDKEKQSSERPKAFIRNAENGNII